ncbi:MAG TPA: hypothetical protein VGE07_19345 [Herpetosiphonaceae bacterium]
MLAKTLIIFGRNTPVFCALALGVRPGLWPLGQRALLVSGGAVLSAWLISATERFVDPDRSGFAWKDFGLNAVVFALSGSLICWYVPLGSYGSDGAVGVALSAVIVGVQYGVLGDAYFFDRRRAALAYVGALAVIAPLFLVGLRATLRLPTTPALLIALAVTLALSPILAVMNYMVGTHDSTTS